MTRNGFPHSDISGSKRVCRSPKLIAAYHVLHRLLMPRHPSCALLCLTKNILNSQLKLLALLYAIVKDQKRLRTRRCRIVTRLHGTFEIQYIESRISIANRWLPSPLRRMYCSSCPAFLRSLCCPAASRQCYTQRHDAGWWACLDSNQGPMPYQGIALTN